MAEVLVTGGTGDLGTQIVPRLLAKGYGVRVLSRRSRPNLPAGARAMQGDLMTGAGLDEALAGADIVVHCATGARDRPIRGLGYRWTARTDVTPTQALLARASASDRPWFVYPSIVGVDKIPLGYYRGKLACEVAIARSGLRHTILRSTQWHTLAAEFCRRATGSPVATVPRGVRSQLLDPGEVAERIVSLIEQGVEGRAPDMGGPRALSFAEIVRGYLHATRKKRVVIELPLPGKAVRGFRVGHNLTPGHADGRVTWEDWLSRNARPAT